MYFTRPYYSKVLITYLTNINNKFSNKLDRGDYKLIFIFLVPLYHIYHSNLKTDPL